ncbi:MAG: hypothetical protein V4525_14210 [Pseudomonadota bacterium]
MIKKTFQLSPLRAFISLLSLASSSSILALPPSTSAYNTDIQHSSVQDQTSEAIAQVNQITCFMKSMAPAEMVNRGPYVALVNEKACKSDSRSDASGSANTSSGGDQINYMRAIVDSTRADNDSPMRVKVWVEDENEGRSSTIFVNLSATTPPSTANPYGTFRMDFALPNPDNIASPMMQGFIDASDTGLSFVERDAEGSNPEQFTRMRLQTSGTLSGSGAASLRSHDSMDNTLTEMTFAYNSDFFRRNNGTQDHCFSRQENEASSSVWQYGLYDGNTGDRIDVKSGFPISVTLNNVPYQGYIGYYGISLPESVQSQLTDGMTIKRFNGNSDANYTLKLSRGRLIKYTKKSRTLASIDQLPFQFFPNGLTINGLPEGATNAMLQAKWDETSHSIIITAYSQCGQNGCLLKDLPMPISIAGSTLANQAQGGIHANSQTLGGDLFLTKEALLQSTQNIFYRSSQLVYPNDTTEVQGKTFHCISNCMTATSLSNFATRSTSNATTPFTSAENNFGPVSASAVISYQMNSQGELEDTSNHQAAIWTASSDALQGTFYGQGIRSGRLVTTLADLECQPSSNTYCSWKADAVESYYEWETGPNNWNKFSGLVDSQSNPVTFDAPLQLSYNVPNNASLYGELAGRTISLQYAGFGQLWGIPGHCVSARDNSEVSCDTQNARYVPAFTIPATVEEGAVSDEHVTYLTKWLDREIRFKKVDASNCSSLTLGDASQLPATTGVKDPSNSTSDIYIGEKPSLSTTAPRVIHGVVQY